jgi:peptidoglycan/LPS O-acetylase OafA/YrhL
MTITIPGEPALADAAAQQNRLGNLDLLRLAAAIMVVLYHYTYSGHAAHGINPVAFPEVAPLTQHLWAGVSLFFMISGFVIAYSAERSSAYDFALSRVARLYPAYLACMTMTCLVVIAAGPQNFPEFQITPMRWLANLTMAPMVLKQPFVDGVYWSILVEITFYGWVALLIAAGVFRKHQLRIIAVWLMISAANEFILESAVANKLFATRYACYFILGILSYRVFAARRKPALAELVLGCLALVMALKSDHHVQTWMQANYLWAADWSLGLSLAKTLAFLSILNLAVRSAPVMSTAWCAVLGGLTYPLYLLHSSIGFVLFHQLDGTLNRWLALAAVFALMVALSYGVYRFVEPPGRRLILKTGSLLKLRPAAAAIPSAR